jgi:hypothetical protein
MNSKRDLVVSLSVYKDSEDICILFVYAPQTKQDEDNDVEFSVIV